MPLIILAVTRVIKSVKEEKKWNKKRKNEEATMAIVKKGTNCLIRLYSGLLK